MSNQLYDAARERAATTGLSWTSGDIRAALIDSSAYTFSAAHQFVSSVAAAAFIAPTSGSQVGLALSSLTATGGSCDAADLTFTSVSGTSIEAVILFQWVSTAANSLLIAYIDSASGLPITPNGGDIIASWDNGTTKIFRV